MKLLAVSLGQTARALADHWWLKTTVAVLAFLFGTDRLVHHMYLALGVLMLVDLATGVWKAAKKGALSPTVGTMATAAKFTVYALILVAARMLEIVVSGALGVQPQVISAVGVKVALVYLALQEAVSIDANLRCVYGVGLGIVLTNLKRLVSPEPPKVPPVP